MDDYYDFPWYLESSKYKDGNTRLSIHAKTHGYIADVYKQARGSNEHIRELAGGLMALAPELMLITRAVVNNALTPDMKELAIYILLNPLSQNLLQISLSGIS